MALWQFTFQIIPTQWAERENYSNLKLLDNEYDFDTKIVWKDIRTSKNIISQLSKLLPLSSKAWHKDLILFGNSSSNDIQLWKENEEIIEIQIRLDLSNFNINLMNEILKFAERNNYSFFIVESKKLIPTNRNTFISSIKNSSANKFLETPICFLENLS